MNEDVGKEAVAMGAVASAAAGIPAAGLERIFHDHHARVYRAAFRITGNTGDAEDVLQTVFLRLARQDGPVPAVANVEAYLCRAAVNAAVDLVKARRVADGEDSVLAAVPDRQPLPDRRLQSRELRERLRQALARLSPKAAEVFALRYFEGYGNPEIAEMLGASQTDIAVTLHRARVRLQEELRSFKGDAS